MNVLAAFAVAMSAPCSEVVHYTPVDDLIELNGAVELFVDTARDVEFSEISETSACDAFETVRAPVRLGANSGRAWLRFSVGLPEHRMTPWELLLDHPPLQQICVHWPLPTGGYQHDCRGRESPRPLTWDRGYRFAVPAIVDATRPMYVSAESESWLRVPIAIGSRSQITHLVAGQRIGFALYFGVLGAFILVGVAFALTTRRATYAWFSLFYGCFAISVGGYRGLLVDLGLPIWTSSQLPQVLLCLHLWFGSLLFSRVLQLQENLPRHHLALWAVPVLSLLSLPLTWIHLPLWTGLNSTLALAWFIVTISASLHLAIRGQEFAMWSLGALSLYMIGGVAMALNLMGVADWPWRHTEFLQRGGAIFSMFLLMLGTARHMRESQKRRSIQRQIATTHRDIALHHVSRDTVTGLSNRSGVRAKLEERVQLADRSGTQPSVAVVGIKGLRELRHARGHQAGNDILFEIGRLFRDGLLPGEDIGALGMDAVAIISDCAGHDASMLAARVHTLSENVGQLARRLQASGLSIHVGATRFPEGGANAEQLMMHAEIAMARAEADHVSWRWFDAVWAETARKQQDMLEELRSALRDRQLAVYYQPVICTTSHRVKGCEALLRWTRPNGTAVHPGVFIALAENHGLMNDITDYVLSEACRQASAWKDMSDAPDWIAVNVSPSQLRGRHLIDAVRTQLSQHHLNGKHIHLEITEGAVVADIAAARAILAELRAMRVHIAIDDFGVGFSSLSHLRSLPVDTLKIDRSFIRGVPEDPEAATVIQAVIRLGTELGLDIVAEGIESLEQFWQLQRWHCTYVQGFLFSPALDAPAFERWASNALHRVSELGETFGTTATSA